VRSTPIGIVMLNDERPHVVAVNEADNLAEVDWFVVRSRIARAKRKCA
jgi:hypothetical protein